MTDWSSYAKEPDLRAVIDPADAKGCKNHYINLLHHKVLKEAICKNLEGKTVLDLGCGTGRFYNLLQSLGAERIVGLDSCEEMLGRYPGPTVRAPTNLIPFPKEHFDAILCVWTLQYLNEKELLETILEMNRVLKPGGAIYLIEQLSFFGYGDVYPRTLVEYYNGFHNHTSVGLNRFRPIIRDSDSVVGVVRKGIVPRCLFNLLSDVHLEFTRHNPETPSSGYLDAFMEFRKVA